MMLLLPYIVEVTRLGGSLATSLLIAMANHVRMLVPIIVTSQEWQIHVRLHWEKMGKSTEDKTLVTPQTYKVHSTVEAC